MSLRRKLDRYNEDELRFMIRKKILKEKRREKMLAVFNKHYKK